MRNFKNTILTLLVSMSMIFSAIPAMSFAEGENQGQNSYENSEGVNSYTKTQEDTGSSTEDTGEPVEDTQENDANQEQQLQSTEEDTTEEDATEEQNKEDEYTITVHFKDNSGLEDGVDPEDAKNAVQQSEELAKPIVFTGYKLNEQFDLTKEADKYGQITSIETTLASKDYYPNMCDARLQGTVSSNTTSANSNDSLNMDIYLEYEYRPFTFTFNYVEKGNESKQLSESEVIHIPGGKYDFNRSEFKAIDGYKYDSVDPSDKLSGNIDVRIGEKVTPEVAKEKSISVNVLYTSKDSNPTPTPTDKQYNVTFNYLDINSKKQIAKPTNYQFKNGESYDFTKSKPQQINGYEYVQTDGNIKGTIKDQDVVITVLYKEVVKPVNKYRIIINYLEEGTNKVIYPQYITVKVGTGTSYDLRNKDAINIPHYKYVNTSGKLSGTVGNEDVIVNVYYRQLENYTITINYIDIYGRQIIKPFKSNPIEEGQKYNVSKYNGIKIKGYKYYKTIGDNLYGVMNSNKVINVYYEETGELAAKTGDYNNILGWGTIAVLAVGGIIFSRRKANK